MRRRLYAEPKGNRETTALFPMSVPANLCRGGMAGASQPRPAPVSSGRGGRPIKSPSIFGEDFKRETHVSRGGLPAAVAARRGAYAATAAAPVLRRRRPQAGKRRGDQGFFDLLC